VLQMCYLCVCTEIFQIENYVYNVFFYGIMWSGASIPIYQWRQMRHGQFWGGMKNQFWGIKKFNIKSVNFVHKFNN